MSLFDTIAEYMNVPYLARRYGGKEPLRLGLAHPSIAPYGVFRLRDGDILISIQNEREWVVLCERVLDLPALAADDRFSSNRIRVANRGELDRLIQDKLGERSMAELIAILDRYRIAYGRVSSMGDLAQHGSLATVTVETPLGPVELIAPPVIVDGDRPAPGRVPALGEHDDSDQNRIRGQGRRLARRNKRSMTLTIDLIHLIRRKPATGRDLDAAALFVLDTLACALGALEDGAGPHAGRRWRRRQPATSLAAPSISAASRTSWKWTTFTGTPSPIPAAS